MERKIINFTTFTELNAFSYKPFAATRLEGVMSLKLESENYWMDGLEVNSVNDNEIEELAIEI